MDKMPNVWFAASDLMWLVRADHVAELRVQDADASEILGDLSGRDSDEVVEICGRLTVGDSDTIALAYCRFGQAWSSLVELFKILDTAMTTRQNSVVMADRKTPIDGPVEWLLAGPTDVALGAGGPRSRTGASLTASDN